MIQRILTDLAKFSHRDPNKPEELVILLLKFDL